MVKLGGGFRMCKKPSQRRKVSGSGNFHSEKINPVMSLIRRKPRAGAEAIKKEVLRDGGNAEWQKCRIA